MLIGTVYYSHSVVHSLLGGGILAYANYGNGLESKQS